MLRCGRRVRPEAQKQAQGDAAHLQVFETAVLNRDATAAQPGDTLHFHALEALTALLSLQTAPRKQGQGKRYMASKCFQAHNFLSDFLNSELEKLSYRPHIEHLAGGRGPLAHKASCSHEQLLTAWKLKKGGLGSDGVLQQRANSPLPR